MSVDAYADVAPVYDAWASRMEGDVEFYVRCAKESGSPVVELGAGSGRVAIPVALAGVDVVAVDASEAMLAVGKRRASEAGLSRRISWIHDDMRTFMADPAVPLVTIPFRSFVHLTTTEDQLATLRSVRRSLVEGGRLVLNLFVPDPAFIAQNDGVRRFVAETTDELGRRCEVWNRTTYDTVTQGMRVGVIRETYEGERLVDVAETVLEARMVYRYEMEHLLARTGFRLVALYGDFDGGPLTETSREMIWVAAA
jgi:ubiquinone/menaquinone biosynthesis C-methylase UbiE